MNGTFEDLVVWGHEALPAADDTFVKGVEEWLQFAEAVCSFVFIFFWYGRVIY
jgi:ribonuclease H2 subunit C